MTTVTTTLQKDPPTPLSAIRRKCLECSGGSSNEVSLCQVEDCSLYSRRFGRNPPGKRRKMSEENKVKAAERWKEYWQKKRKMDKTGKK